MEGSTTMLSSVVTADMLKGVLNEILGVLPIVIPVVISCVAVRKGISFVVGSMQSA